MRRDEAFLLDMLIAAPKALKFLEGIDQNEFEENEIVQNAVLRPLEINGEAAARISSKFRNAHSEIPWKDMVGLRNLLIHECFRIEYGAVWDTIQNDLPALIEQIEPLTPKKTSYSRNPFSIETCSSFAQSMTKPPLILIVGPTAVGKTEIAIQLAERLNGEIVSADSRVFYRGMDIGTAKPTTEEQARVPHHLIDIANPDEILSLAVFQQKAREVIEDIHTRNKLPFLVGGTGQYVRAVTQGWTPPEVEPDGALRNELERQKKENGIYWLHDKLKDLDPEAASKIDPRNYRRTIRALEVIMTTGKKFSEQRGQSDSPYHLVTIGLTRPREELYQRVDERIDIMFANGFVDEVKRLLDKGCSPSLPTMSAIGYRECVSVIKGELSEEQAKVQIRRATRVYVRRQANWFKVSDPSIHWFRVEDGIVDTIQKNIHQLVDF